MKFFDPSGPSALTDALTDDQIQALKAGARVASFPDPKRPQPEIYTKPGPATPCKTQIFDGETDCFVFREDWGRQKSWGGFAGNNMPLVMTDMGAVRELLRATGVANDTEIDLGNGKVLVLEDIILAPVEGAGEDDAR